MTLRTPLTLSVVAALALTACSTDPNAYGGASDPNARTRGGAITGALIGGAIGAASGEDRFERAIAGAALGAAAGAVAGNVLDRQAADLRAAMSANTTVTNTGNALVVTMPQDILFAFDSATLRPDLQSDLRAVARNLINYPNSTIEIADVLRSSGVPSSRITAFGRGEDQPIASNLTAAGQAQNRRVEIIIRPSTQG